MGIAAAIAVAGTAACNSSPTQSLPACTVATARSVGSLAVGQSNSFDPTAIGSCLGFPANASSSNSAEYLIVAQSAAPTTGDSSPFMLTGISPAGAVATVASRRAWLPPARSAAATFDAFLRSPDRPWNAPARSASVVPAAPSQVTPPVLGSLRTFVVCATTSCAVVGGTTPVTARAEAVGTNVAIYIDTVSPLGGPTAGLATADLDSLLQVMDTRIYPLDLQAFGPVSDIDANGVVIALMTPVVNRLVSRASCETTGYIAGFFYPYDLTPGQPFNNGEIYYTIVPDPDSVESCPHTVANVERITGPTFAHELEHMINYGQHTLSRPGGAGPEEGWLDEGLARYAEELAARSFLPGDTATFHSYLILGDLYDAYQYLLNPGASYLEIIQDNGTLAESGASWLFVRYLVDQYGASLPAKLVQSGFVGAPNVVRHTGASSFQSLVANWALANWVSDLPGFTPASTLQYTSWSFRAEYDTLNQFDPRHFPLPFPLAPLTVPGSAIGLAGELRSGSGWYSLAVQVPSGPPFALNFTLDANTRLPTTVFPQLTVLRIQ